MLITALIVGCTRGTRQATPAAVETTTTATPATTRATATTEPVRPRWCGFYDDWKQAGDTMARLERQHGSKVTSWPADAYKRWELAHAAQGRAAGDLARNARNFAF